MSLAGPSSIFIFKYKDILWEAYKFGKNEFISDVNGFIYNIMDWTSRNELLPLLEIEVKFAVIHEDNVDRFYDEIIRPGISFEL